MKTKAILLLILIFLSVSIVFSQTKEQELSNAEKFSGKAGTLIQKEFIDIGEIKGAKIKVIHYSDLIGETKTSSLRFESESVGKYTSSSKIAVLDSDEIEGLIKSIKIIQEKVFPSTPSSYSEVTFRSRGGFEAGCYWGKDKWETYLKLEKYDKDSYVFLGVEDFPALLALLEAAKLKL